MEAAPLSGARTRNTGDGIALSDFFQRIFKPARLAGRRWDRVGKYPRAIRYLAATIGRPPLLADLTKANILEVRSKLLAAGYSPLTVVDITKSLGGMGLHAWRSGLLPNYDPSGTRFAQRKMKVKPARPAWPPGTLGNMFLQLRGQVPKEALWNFAVWIRRLDAHLGRFAVLDDINPATIRTLQESLMESAASVFKVRDAGIILRRIRNTLTGKQVRALKLPEPAAGTLRHFYHTVYRPLQLTGSSLSTTKAFRTFFLAQYLHYGRDVSLSEMGDELAADHFAWLLGRGLRAVTVNGHRALWFAMWRFAAERGMVVQKPNVRKLRESLDPPDAWSIEEFQRIVAAAFLVRWPTPSISGIPTAPYFRALLLVAYWTGLRRRSLFTLRRSDVDLESGWVTISGTSIKNRRGKRLRLGADAIEALRQIWQPERDLVFPWPYADCGHLNLYLRLIFRQAKVPKSTRKVMTQLHKVRRTVATLATIARGIEAASTLLGHSGSEVTKRYVDPAKLIDQDATEILPVLF